MQFFNVTGMSCAACSARVEKAVLAVEGVTSCSVSLLTNSMSVEGEASSQSIISAVKAAGYGATRKGDKKQTENKNEDTKKPVVLRFIVSVILLLILMYVSMGSMIGLPQPEVFTANPLAAGLTQLLLSGIILVINQAFFISGLRGFKNKSPNMDTLVALGSGASFVYSVCILFMMTKNPSHSLLHGLYFESAAMILTLITLGKMLEARSKDKTVQAIKGLLALAPKTATVIRDGGEKRIDISDLKAGDVFVVRPGESIPADGIVIEGVTAVNEAALTGESIPADKTVGDSVSAATVNQLGFIKCRATDVGEDTALSKIIKLMSEASATKAPIARIADKVSAVFVPAVMVIAIITTLVWLIFGAEIGFSLARGISVLVISCPCALGLATPVAIMVGSSKGAMSGILFKNAQALENTGKADIIVFDKTGTVTEGVPEVTDLIPFDRTDEELLAFALSVEQRSEHPLAKAVVSFAEERGIKPKDVTDFKVLAGNGVECLKEGKKSVGGSFKFIKTVVKTDEKTTKIYEELSRQGKTPLFFAENGILAGVIALSDTIKKDSRESVEQLKTLGKRVIMLTGDNKNTAEAIGNRAGITEIISEVLPDEKAQVISKLKSEGRVIMVGDGINDAPALSIADVGIAIGTGTDIAIEAADAVVMKSRLTDVVAAVRLGKATLRNIKQNLFWAFAYNTLGIPLAAGLFIPIFGLTLEPMFAAAAMSLSSFCVVTNALRLNGAKIYKNKVKKVKTMTKTIKVEGMMCPHCEAHVKKALEALDGVKEATASHKDGTVILLLSAEVSDETVKKTIEAEGYKVI